LIQCVFLSFEKKNLLFNDESSPSHGYGNGVRSHYNHPVVKINEADLERWNHLRGVPLIFEHGAGQRSRIAVGSVLDTTLQKDDSLYIVASVYDNDEGNWAGEQIKAGQISGFSVGYEVVPDRFGQVAQKNIQEVSLVLKPFFECAKISVCASDSAAYNTNEKNRDDKIFVPVFSMETKPPTATQEPAPTETTTPRDPVGEIQNVAVEMELKQLKEKQARDEKELADLRKKNDAEAEELNRYRAEKKAQLEREAESKRKELDEAMAKIQKGTGLEKLPEEYIQDNRGVAEAMVYLNADDKNRKPVEVAASMTMKIAESLSSYQSENDRLKQELDELKKTMLEKESQVARATDRIQASRQAVYDHDQPKDKGKEEIKTETVQASSNPPPPLLHGSRLSDILTIPAIKPNTWEGNIYKDQYNPSFNAMSPYGVHASVSEQTSETQTVTVKAPGTHKHMDWVPHSERFRTDQDGNPVGAAWFAHKTQHYRPGLAVTPGFKVESSYKVERTTN
jgi:hypothetical protein